MEEIIKNALRKVSGVDDVGIETPEVESHGDYASNIALVIAKKEKKNPKEVAGSYANELSKDNNLSKYISKIEVAGPGFINFWISKEALIEILEKTIEKKDSFGKSDYLKEKRMMVEYAHPNTHKELHIGHMRTLILGESISRILEACGAKVFRANYQGDVGPHVAKSIWGARKIIKGKKLTWEEVEKKYDLFEKVKLLADGYVLGVKEYEKEKKDIDEINSQIYQGKGEIIDTYKRTRKWSLDYYDHYYLRFNTKFDKLYFESEVSSKGREIVEKNTGNIFEKSEGAIVFDGEKYSLHKRVFITKDLNPTYEAKDMGLAPTQYKDFPFDKNVHVVANEQKAYFEVVFKALELIDPKFKGKMEHLPMGMVNIVGKKMSSRTGEILSVENLLTEVKELLNPLIEKGIKGKEKEEILEKVTLGAIKYSVLKVNPKVNVVFDPKKSVDLQGNSGPYLQYTFARCQSVLKKAKEDNNLKTKKDVQLNEEETKLLRALAQYQGIIIDAANNYSPNLICTYLHDLAQKYNHFYNKHKIIKSKEKDMRIKITLATAQVLKNGLNLLGIDTSRRM